MYTFLAALFAGILGVSATHAQQAPLDPVMKHIRADEWDAAYVAARAISPVASDIVTWRHLRAGEGDLGDYLAFLTQNPDWPGLDKIRRRGEAMLTPHSDVSDILGFFGDTTPRSGNGVYHLSRALRATGDSEHADEVLVDAWRTIMMTNGEEKHLLAEHGAVLRPHNAERMDMLLWRGETESAENFLPQVNSDWRKLATARVALRRGRSGVDALIAKVPSQLSDDPGLAYERFLWRLRKGRAETAIDLMFERSVTTARLGQPSRWAGQRRQIVRQLMRDGMHQSAYQLASSHHLESGSAFADLEWALLHGASAAHNLPLPIDIAQAPASNSGRPSSVILFRMCTPILTSVF